MRAQLLVLALVFAPLSASATFHLWDITEIYSNADGSVQFVELEVVNPIDDEGFVGGKILKSNGTSYPVPSNLPATTTTHYLLFATPAFASQLCRVSPGVFIHLTPDFTFNAPNFMSTAGPDVINWAGGFDTFSYVAAELPTNGIDSLNEPFGSNTRTTVVNSPTNYAGQTCALPEPSGWLALFSGAALLLGLARTRRPA
jgi:hypothetical protein